MKVTPSRDVAMRIPGNSVRGALCDVSVAMRALPDLVVICSRAGGGLHNVLNAVLDFDFFDTRANHIEVQLWNLVTLFALWPIAAWH
jgi:hypothetical protein